MKNRLIGQDGRALDFTFIRTYKPAPKVSAEIPLGLLYVIAAVREKFPGRFRYHIIDMPLKGLSIDQAAEEALRLNSDLVGISAFTYENEIVKGLVRKLRRHRENATILIGGPYATASTALAVEENPGSDFIMMGEAEISLPALLDLLFQGGNAERLSGIAYHGGGQPVIRPHREFIKDLDALPFPAWDLLDIDSYNDSPLRPTNHFRKQKRAVPVFTSRGCPCRCAYCHQLFGKKLRVRGADDVLEELLMLHGKYGVREIHILDDAFNLDGPRMREICRRLIDHELNLSIGLSSGLRGDHLVESDIDLLKAAGVYFIRYAVETASPRLQKKIHKHVKLEKLKKIVDYTVKKKIFTQGLFMLGFPTETPEELKLTVDYGLKSKFHAIGVYQVVPFPGTDLYAMAREVRPDYAYDPHYLFFSGKSFYQEMTGIDLNPIKRNFYLRFYTNPSRLFRIFRDVPEKNGLFRGGISILNNTLFRKSWLKKGFIRQDPLEAR